MWIATPSTICTSPDMPGIKSSFTMEVFSGVSLKENLVFTDVSKIEDVECLVLSQENESESEQFKPLLDMGMKLKFLVYREENIDSLSDLAFILFLYIKLLQTLSQPDPLSSLDLLVTIGDLFV